MRQKKSPVLAGDAGVDNKNILVQKLRIPKGYEPRNQYEAKLLWYFHQETSLTRERRSHGQWLRCRSSACGTAGLRMLPELWNRNAMTGGGA